MIDGIWKLNMNQDGLDISRTYSFSGDSFIFTETFIGLHGLLSIQQNEIDSMNEQVIRNRVQGIKSNWEILDNDRIRWSYIYSGTYSISSRQIEFAYSDGTMRTQSFSQTENTVTLDGFRFARQ